MTTSKKIKNKLMINSIVVASTLIVACNSGTKENIHQNDTDLKNASDYTMLFDIQPSNPVAGEVTTILLRPVKTGTDSTVVLEVQHQKKIHFIVVSEDLSSFRHIHPVEVANGSYTITNNFDNGGNYLMYADYKPSIGEKQVVMEQIKVTGNQVNPVSYEKQVLISDPDGYRVVLQIPDTAIVSNKELMINAEISQTGLKLSPDQLEDYLGEKAHMVIIGVANKKYLHVHPMVMGGELMLHTSFPEAGMYRAWLEFKKDGKINIADFVIVVSNGNTEKPAAGKHQH